MRCRICQRQIVILIRRGTGICCNQCEKIETGELTTEEALIFILQVNPQRYKYLEEFMGNNGYRRINATEA